MQLLVVEVVSMLPSVPCCPEQRGETLSCENLESIWKSDIESLTALKLQVFRLLIRKAQFHFLR